MHDKKIQNLLIFGPVEGPTGYDDHTRAFIKSFIKLGINLKVVHHDTWCGAKVPHPLDGIINILRSKKNFKPDAALHMALPDQCGIAAGVPNFNYTMFEADRIPKSWVKASDAMTGTILSNNFCRQAWKNSGADATKLGVVPLGFDIDALKHSNVVYPLHTDRGEVIQLNFSKRFIFVGELVERKNILELLSCWIRATENISDAILILKIYSYSSSRLKRFRDDVEKLSEEAAEWVEECAPIVFFEQMLNEDEMYALYNTATHYISLSKGEGWDLNAIKCAGLGKQLVVPWHSAYKEYLDKKYVYPIKVSDVPEPAQQYGGTARLFRNANWFTIDHDSAIEQIQRAISDDCSFNEELQRHILNNFTYDIAAKKMLAEMERMINDQSIIEVGNTEQKAIVVCPSLGTRCGIAEYTKKLFNQGFSQLGKRDIEVLAVKAAGDAIVSGAMRHRAKIIHYQHEYGILDSAVLEYTSKQLHRRGVKIALTQHSFSREAIVHNDRIINAVDALILHSKDQYDAYINMNYGLEDKIIHIPHGVDPIIDISNNTDAVIDKDGKIAIGFFGFCFHHKGLQRLLIEFARFKNINANILLVILSSKHKDDIEATFEETHSLINHLGLREGEDYIWESQYLEEDIIKTLLAQCDAIVLPYRDYGAIGSSGAVLTAMSSGTPVFVTPASWFSEMPFLPRIPYSAAFLDSVLERIDDESFNERYKKELSSFVNKFNWEKVASFHLQIYQDLISGRL